MEAVKKCVPIKKLPISHFKKKILFHLDAALVAAEGLVERNSLEGYKQVCKGLKLFIHNIRAWI